MNTRNKFLYLIITGGILLGLTIVLITNVRSTPASAQKGEFIRRSLVDASPEEVSEVAIQYTKAFIKVLSGTPQVLLARSITKEDLTTLELSPIDFSGQDPPLMIVAVKGDFDVSGYIPGSADAPWRVNYIVYVFDLKAGIPTLTEVSAKGGRFSKLLNDPTLKDDETSQQLQPAQGSPDKRIPEAPAVKVPYGAIVPEVEQPPDTEPPLETEEEVK